MTTTSIDDANLAEIADLLVDIEKTNKELKSQIPITSRPSPSWFSFVAVAAAAASFGILAGAVITRGIL